MTTKEQHILVAYTYSLNNIGDISNTSGMVNLLNESFPDMPVRVLASQVKGSGDYRLVEDYYQRWKRNCSTLPNPFKHHCGQPQAVTGEATTPWQRFCKRWGMHKLDAFNKGCIASDLAEAIAADLLGDYTRDVIDTMRNDDPAAYTALQSAAYLVYSSGTVLNFGRLQVRDFWTYALHFSLPLMVARQLGIPYGINAHSFDAIDWPGDRVIGPLLKDAEFVYARDSDSLNYLRQRGLNNREDGYRPDTSFFFKVRDAQWAEAFLSAKGLVNREFLVLITRHSALKQDANSEWDKVGGDPTAGSVSIDRQREQMRKLRLLVVEWIRITGMPVLMALETRHAADPMREWLAGDYPDDVCDKIIWLDEFWSSEQAFSVYEQARVIVSMEMHSIIMGIKANTPVVHVPFRECGRKARMMHCLGLGEWLLDCDEMEDNALPETCLRIHRNFTEAVDKTRKAATQADELGRQVMQVIARKL